MSNGRKCSCGASVKTCGGTFKLTGSRKHVRGLKCTNCGFVDAMPTGRDQREGKECYRCKKGKLKPEYKSNPHAGVRCSRCQDTGSAKKEGEKCKNQVCSRTGKLTWRCNARKKR